MALLAGGGAGVAIAADGAAPGDPLYPIDLLVEAVGDSIGVTDGHASERFTEAAGLLEHGDVLGALDTARRGASEPMDRGLSADLETAVDRIEAIAASDPLSAAAALQDLLTAAVRIAEAPAEAGQVIAEIARTVPSADVGAADGTPGPSLEPVQPTAPPGLDPEFTPPGQDPESIPPGQDPDFIPPGQDPDFIPPGQDPDFVPPGQRAGGPPGGDG